MSNKQVAERTAYAEKLKAMADDELVGEIEQKVWLSAFAGNNPRSKYHWQTDACYDEAKRRDKSWLYQRGWNAAYSSAGHDPSAREIDAAKDPSLHSID